MVVSAEVVDDVVVLVVMSEQSTEYALHNSG